MGGSGYSSPHLQKKTEESGRLMSKVQERRYQGLQLSIPFVCQDIDLYNPESAETLLFEDGIVVKRQKDVRKDQAYEKPTKRVQTDVISLAKPTSGYRYICPLFSDCLTMDDLLRAEWSLIYQGIPQNLIVISDGAKNIRERLERVFNHRPQIILDWYHLKKKTGEFFSMMGLRKPQKETHIKTLLNYLWCGEYDQAYQYLKSSVKPRKDRTYKKEELLQYLKKHKQEIINYDQRKKCGKTVGSGKAEATVNQVVGVRQKKKGSSWTPNGCKALAIIKTCQLNGEFDSFWEEQSAA